MIQACVFCLSQDRDLLMIDESLYFSVYPSFKEKNNEYINYLKAENLLKLCWECQGRVTNLKKFLATAERSLNTLKMVMVLPSGELPNSESRLHITTAYCIDIEGSVPPLLPPIVEQNIDDADHSAVEPIQQQQKDNDVSVTAVKLELNLDELDDNDIGNDDGDRQDSDTQGLFSNNNVSKDGQINNDNDTTSNEYIIKDDHRPPAVWVAPLPLMIPISQCKRVSKQSRSLGKECDTKTISKQTSLPGKESIRKIKLSDSNLSKNGNINNGNDTTSNKHIEIEDDDNEPIEDDDNKHIEDDDNEHIEDDDNEHIEDDDNEHIEDDDNKHIEDDDNEHIEDDDNEHIVDDDNEHIEDDDNKHIEDDDRPPAVRVKPLPLMIPISQCKRVYSKQTRLPGKDSIKKMKLSDDNVSNNDNINNDNDTMSNKHVEDDDNKHIKDDDNKHIEDDENEHIEDDDNEHFEDDDNKQIEDDDRPPAVSVEPLPLMITISQCKKVYSKKTRLPGKDSIKKIKLSDDNVSKNDNINNDTTSNKLIEDDHSLPAVRVEPLPLIIPISQCKRVSKQTSLPGKKRFIKIKGSRPKRLKFSKVWASSEQAMRWHREELRRAREASLSFVHECDACERLFATDEDLRRHVGDAHSEEAGQYTCDVCLYRFPDQTKLKKHMEAHYINYKCETCSFESRILTEMQKHVSDTHPNTKCLKCRNKFASKAELDLHFNLCETYKCSYCKVKFPFREMYMEHTQKHLADPDGIYCEVCDVFCSPSRYKEHLRTNMKHVSRDSFKHECEICHNKYPTARGLGQHMVGTHKRPGPHPCDLCQKSFFRKFRLLNHRAAVHKIGPGKVKKKREMDKMCETCGKRFMTGVALSSHRNSHTGEQPWRCPDCPAAFTSSSNLWLHRVKIHDKTVNRRENKPNKLCCDECGKQLSSPSKLKYHCDFYHLKKALPFQCTICDKYFRKATRLQKHARVHKRVPCEPCGQWFKDAEALNKHLKKHSLPSWKGPYKCRSCGGTYSNVPEHYKLKHLHLKKVDRVRIKNLFNLDKAVEVIWMDKKFSCDVCGKQFLSPSELKYHYDFYHLKKALPFQCTICDKYFRRASALRVHARTHMHLPCEPCGKWFKDAEALDKHLKKHSLPSWKEPDKCRSCGGSYSNLYEHYKLKHLHLKKDDRVRIKNLLNLDKEVEVIWIDKNTSGGPEPCAGTPPRTRASRASPAGCGSRTQRRSTST